MEPCTKKQILEADDRPTEEVEVPEWGGTVTVQTISARERDSFETGCWEEDPDDKKKKRLTTANIRARLVVRCVVGPDGGRMFSDAEAKQLGDKSGAAMDRVYEVAQRLNKMREEDIEALAANFGTTQGDDSPSD